MAMRNAFDNLGEETTLRRILQAITFAKDPADRLRVIADGTTTVAGTVTSTINAGNAAAVIGATNVPPYNQAAWNAVDAREEYQIISQQSMQNERARWSIT